MDGPFAVGFLGAGQMATALAGGWAAAGLLDLPRCRAADPHPSLCRTRAARQIKCDGSLAHDALLVTRNLNDSKRVKGLRIEDWSA